MTTEKPLVWLRAEQKAGEARTAVVPTSAARLVAAGFPVVVEHSADRVFSVEEYELVGCGTAPRDAWRDQAPDDAIIIGLKELDPQRGRLRHRHVHFAHAFKKQRGWQDMLRAFHTGGGRLFDLEYLVDDAGRRVAAFGARAGFVGAALGLLSYAGQGAGRTPSLRSLKPWRDAESLVADVTAALTTLTSDRADVPSRGAPSSRPRVLLIGAHGRSGQGAMTLCQACGIDVTPWDLEETASGGPFDAVREHDVLISCVFVDAPLAPFATWASLERSRRALRVIVDVGCDPYGEYNPLPLYDSPTSLEVPVQRLVEATSSSGVTDPDPPLDLIAIDHLPSLLPRESSEEFSALLLPHLLTLDRLDTGVWGRASAVFDARVAEMLAGHQVSGAGRRSR